MQKYEPPETGTLIIAALLLLGLAFAGYWIITYVQPGGHPQALFPWFGAAALAIVVIGLVAYLFNTRKRRG